MGQPQYLCLEIPQSFNLKLIFLFPKLFFSKYSIVFEIESLGDFKLLRKEELIIYPGPVYAWSSIWYSVLFLSGDTTVLTFKLYFLAKSKSRWSCAGHPKTAPNP